MMFRAAHKRLTTRIRPLGSGSILKSRQSVSFSTAIDAEADSYSGPIASSPNSTPPLQGVPSRFEQLSALRLGEEYDVLIIGGGATGAGAALDAASRGLKVACIERGDFASETSSRSTKLIWAGIRYLATSAAGLLSKRLLTSPVETSKDFYGEFKVRWSEGWEERSDSKIIIAPSYITSNLLLVTLLLTPLFSSLIARWSSTAIKRGGTCWKSRHI